MQPMTPTPPPPATAKLVPPSVGDIYSRWQGSHPKRISEWLHAILSECAISLPAGPPPYDPAFGDDRLCVCGHSYYRHFDGYEGNAPVGCKYCECETFVPAPAAPAQARPEAQPVTATCPKCGGLMAKWQGHNDGGGPVLRCITCGEQRPMGWRGDQQARPEAERPVDPAATITLGELAKIIGDMLGDNPATNMALRQVHDRCVDLVRGRSEGGGEQWALDLMIESVRKREARNREEIRREVFEEAAKICDDTAQRWKQAADDRASEGDYARGLDAMVLSATGVDIAAALRAAAGGERDGGK
jgi:hypothetical protein